MISQEGKKEIIDAAHVLVQGMVSEVRRHGSRHAEHVVYGVVMASNYFHMLVFGSLEGNVHPTAAFGLCRTLFEMACSTSYLAKHPEHLQDYIDFGRFMHLEMERKLGVNPAELNSPFPDAAALDARFKGQRGISTWHRQRLEKLAVQAGFNEYGCQAFYKATSQVIHGDALPSLMAIRYTPQLGWRDCVFTGPPPEHFTDAITVTVAVFVQVLTNVSEALRLQTARLQIEAFKLLWKYRGEIQGPS